MNDSKNRAGVSKRRHARVIKVAPVTRAIRSALAISATTLALTASGGVLAGTFAIPATTAIHHDVARRDVFEPVIDPTVVHGDFAPASVYSSSASDAWSRAATPGGIAQDDSHAMSVSTSLGDVADLTTVRAGTAGPGGVSGSDDHVSYSWVDPTRYGLAYGSFSPYSSNSNYGIADVAFVQVAGVAALVNYSSITATGYTWAAGFEVEASNYAHDVRNAAGSTITASTDGIYGQSWGIYAVSGNDTEVFNDGTVNVSASGSYGTATGLYSGATSGVAHAVNTGTINASVSGNYGTAVGVAAVAYGDANVANSGTINASATGKYASATGMLAYSATGTADLLNTSAITVSTLSGNAVGMYGYAVAGNVVATNSGAINVASLGGLADGIFASGVDVDVTNSAGITAAGGTWAAGIEAQGTDGTTVSNSSVISAVAGLPYGHAFGIYATSGAGGATVTNTADITALGSYAAGVQVTADGDVTITNSVAGDVVAGNQNSYLAAGIYATTNYEGADITVVNDGTVSATSLYGSSGITVAALGLGSSASVTNTGAVTAIAYSGYGYGATGILASADGDAGIDTSNSIVAYSNGNAYGAVAAAFNGNASVVSAGSIAVGGYSAYGVIAASSYGAASIDNSADVHANGYYFGRGLEANGVAGATIENGGYVQVSAAFAYGAFADSGNGVALITNTATGDIEAYGYVGIGAIGISTDGDVAIDNVGGRILGQGYAQGVGTFALSYYGNAATTNSGTVYGLSYVGPGVGMFARADAGDASITNAGQALGISQYGDGAGARVSGLTAEVTNYGTIVGASYYGTRATGIDAYGGDSLTIDNQYHVGAIAKYGNEAFGVYAVAGGDLSITNGVDGQIIAQAPYGAATGVLAYALAGNAGIDNTGLVYADGSYSLGIFIGAATGNASATNTGAIIAQGYYGALGVEGYSNSGNVILGNVGDGSIDALTQQGKAVGMAAYSATGSATVANSGDINANSYNGTAIGLSTNTGSGIATAHNGGTLYASSYSGSAIGIAGYSATGSVSLTNSGLISSGAPTAYGILATAGQGDVSVGNLAGGSVNATSDYGVAFGILGVSTVGNVAIDNAGGIHSSSPGGAAFGIWAASYNGDVAVTGTGDIDAEGASATGLYAAAVGTVTIATSGAITATSATDAFGILAYGYGGTVATSGAVTANGVDNAAGVALSVYGNGSVANGAGGSISATANGAAYGAVAYSYAGVASADNQGTINASTTYAGGIAVGVLVQGNAGAQVLNGGLVSAGSVAGATAIGVNAQADGNVLVNNAGRIYATDGDYAVAVRADSASGVATVVNSGVLRTFSTLEGQVAVSGGDGVQQIANYGQVFGAIVTAGGDDAMFNGDAGVWHVSNHSTDFGSGDDVITNAGAGTIVLANGAIHMGASGSGGNDFVNFGRVLVQGDGLIDMGYAVALAAAPNALPLTNNGVLDMVDGATNDSLTIAGDLAGSGSVDVDVNPLAKHADQLYVDGSVSGSQKVDINLVGTTLSSHFDPVVFAHVSGDSSADSFVGGRVIGYDESTFLDLAINVVSQIDTSNATADVFSVGLDVLGLNNAGSLGATMAAVAQGVTTSQIGTWRQRMGVIAPRRDDQAGLSPWIRVFGDSGSVKLAHRETNFGGTGAFGFDQSNDGREFGMNVNIRGDLNIGLLAAKTTGIQHLTGTGVGSDHLDSTAFGMYATWIAPTFYLDASYRWLDFNAHMRSAGGLQGSSGNGGAFNVEAGFTAWNFAGIAVTPEVQYTRSRVGDFRIHGGNNVDFVPNGGASTRGRLGVEFSKTMDAAGWALTPYGSVNAIREFDGETNYTVANQFTGFTSSKGTSAMVELGMGAQKDGFAVTGGANWTDGGAYQGVLGGQVVVRYSW